MNEHAPAEEPQPHTDPGGPVRYPSTIGGACYLLVLVAVLVALVIVVLGDWRTGVRVIGGALVFSATARVVLRDRDAGMLAVRHKALDVTGLLVIAGLLIFLAGSIPEQPGF